MRATFIQTSRRWKNLTALALAGSLALAACQSAPSPTPQEKPEATPRDAGNKIHVTPRDTVQQPATPGINDLNAKGFSPLHEAVLANKVRRVRDLIEQGASVNLYSKSRMNPLYYAADCNRLEILKMLLDAGAWIDAPSDRGWTPLLIAAERGHTRIVAELLRRGANVHTAETWGWTALHSAAVNGHQKVLRLLIEYGADVNTRQFPDTVLHQAAIKGQVCTAEILIDHGALIDQMNTSGAMPLHLAISYSHKDVINLLLDRGADPNAVASNGFTPLITAWKWPGVQDRPTIALLLRLYGAE